MRLAAGGAARVADGAGRLATMSRARMGRRSIIRPSSPLMVNEASKSRQRQLTLPDPALDTLHLALPLISTLPDPAIDTSALSLALAATLPEPMIVTSAVRAASPAARSEERRV